MRPLRAVAWASILALACAPFAQARQLQSGVQSFQRGDYQHALIQFQAALRAQPGNAKIENLIGITQTKLGRIEDANQHYQNAIRLDPRFTGPYKNLGFNLLNDKQYSLSEKYLNSALRLDPKDPFAHYYLLLDYLATSRDQDAAAQAIAAAPLLQNDPQTSFLLVKAYLRLNRVPEALDIIHKSEQDFSVAQEYELAGIFDSSHRYSEALDRFRQIAKMQPGSWVSGYNLAVALLHARNADQAIPLIRSLSAKRPRDANLFTLLGAAYEQQNNLPQALDAYRNAVRVDPRDPDRYLDYTRLLMDLDRYDQAMRIIQKGLPGVQDTYALNLRLGTVQMMEGNYDLARQSFQKAIDAHPEIVIGHIALAKTYMEQGNDAQAAKVLAAARARLPQDFALEYVFGLVSSRLGDDQQALAALKNAARLGPAMAEPHFELGKLYMKSKQWTPAQAEFEKAIQLDPQNAQAHFQLSRLYARLGESAKSQAMAARTQQLMQAQRKQAIKQQQLRILSFHARDAQE